MGINIKVVSSFVEDIVKVVKKAKHGDKEALVELVMRRKDQLYRIAWSYMHHEQDARDVLQETIIKAFHDIVDLREERVFYTWYVRILINTCKHALQKRKKVLHLEDVKLAAPGTRNLEDAIDIQAGMEKLDPEHREILYMRYMEDLPVKEIASILEIPEGTVKSRIYYGLSGLRKYMGERKGTRHGM